MASSTLPSTESGEKFINKNEEEAFIDEIKNID